MKVAGIIAEYNPFHNGHKYHLEQTRSVTGADYVIAVISGNFMQRGNPAIIDKYTRTKMALLNGADLVLELPLFYATGSAEFFALGAVSLLDKLGAVDALCFGSENGSSDILSQAASILLLEPEHYRKLLQEGLRKGLSFPKARSLALEACLPTSFQGSDFLSSPNNILGMEYLKALIKRKSTIVPYTVKRMGNSYHQPSLSAKEQDSGLLLSSASAIRSHIMKGEISSQLQAHVPSSVFSLLKDAHLKGFPISSNDFSLLLQYKLLAEAKKDYTDYLDVSPALSDKIKKNLNQFQSFEQFCAQLKSKDMTYSRISRSLLHILLEMTAKELTSYTENDYIFYARILGFKKSSADLLTILKEKSNVPLISKLADAPSYLSAPGLSMLEKDILATHIYEAVLSSKFHVPFINEYKKQLIILP